MKGQESLETKGEVSKVIYLIAFVSNTTMSKFFCSFSAKKLFLFRNSISCCESRNKFDNFWKSFSHKEFFLELWPEKSPIVLHHCELECWRLNSLHHSLHCSQVTFHQWRFILAMTTQKELLWPYFCRDCELISHERQTLSTNAF